MNVWSKNPWRGPRCFTTKDTGTFFGRTEDVVRLSEKIARERLVILTGGSGFGKTSLLQAGVMPALEALLKREVPRPDEFGESVICIARDWGQKSGTVRQKLTACVEAAVGLVTTDKQSKGDIGATIKSTLEKHPCCVVMLDQFEELVWPNDQEGREGINIVAELFENFDQRVRIVLCLRDEFLSLLRPLEMRIGSLYGRTYFLEQMTTDTAGAMIRSVVKTLPARHKVAESGVACLLSSAAAMAGTGASEEQPVDLIVLQCLCHAFWRHAEKEGLQTADETNVSRFLAELREREVRECGDEEPGSNRGQQDVRNMIVRDWIGYVLGQIGENVPKEVESPYLRLLPRARRISVLRRMAGQVMPVVSNGDRKVTVSEEELTYRVLAHDITKLQWRGAPLHRKGFLGRDGKVRVSNLPERHAARHAETRLSGISLAFPFAGHERPLTPRETASFLQESLTTCIRLLEKEQILKSCAIPEGMAWELTHDRLSKPLLMWSEDTAGTLENAVAAVTATSGKTIILTESMCRKVRVVENARWLGCWIEHVGGGPNGIPVSLRFKDCNLRGTVFHFCNLQNAAFERCNLDGVLFVGCTLGGPKGKVTFRDCEAGGMAFVPDSSGERDTVNTLGEVSFVDTRLTQCLFTGIDLKGCVEFKITKTATPRKNQDTKEFLHLCDFRGIHRGTRTASIKCTEDINSGSCDRDRAAIEMWRVT